MRRRGHPGRILARKLRRDVWRQRWQFAAVAVTIMLGVALYAASYDTFQNLEASYHRTYRRLALADLTASGGPEAAFARAARDTPGVEAVTRRVQADVPIRITGGHQLLGRLVGLPADGRPAVGRVEVLEGRHLDAADPAGVLVERHMASHFGLHPGDTLEALTADGFTRVRVRGIVASPEYLWPARSRQEVLTTPDAFGVVFAANRLVEGAPARARVAQSLVAYAPGADRPALDATLARRAADMGIGDVMTRAEQPSNAALSEDLQGFGQVAVLFPLLFLTAAGMATLVLVNRMVWSQRSAIGTMTAEGVGHRTVMWHYLSFGLLIGLAGALAGVAIGVPLGALVTGTYTSALSIPDTVTRVNPWTPTLGILFGLTMGALAALAPAATALRMTPAEAMRGFAPPVGPAHSLVERLFPPARRLPIRWRLPLRAIGRSKRRSLATVLGIVLSLVLILASWGMIDTVQLLTQRQFDRIQRDDARVYFAGPPDESVLRQVRSVPGVAAVEELVSLPATVRRGGAGYATELQGYRAGTTMHTFLAPSGDAVALPADGILAGRALSHLLGVRAGDRVTVSFSTLGTRIDTRIAGFVDEPLGTYVYMRADTLRRSLAAASPPLPSTALASPAVTSALVSYGPGARPAAVRDDLGRLGAVAAVVTSDALAQLVNQYLAFFYAFVGVMLAFGAILAFSLIFNAISVSVAERSVEFATMRANGLSPGEISAMLARENLLLSLVGIPVGLVVGYRVAALMMSSYTSDLFSFELQMRTSTLVLSGLAVLAVVLAAQWPASRATRRLDIARVVRERAQ